MRFSDIVKVASVLLAGVVVTACGNDASKPATIDEQRAAMHHAPPSADALKDAMSKIHFKTPGQSTPQAPPEGTALPGGVKTGH